MNTRSRYLDVVEDHERVLFVEARRKRTVEVVGAGSRHRVTAQEHEAGGIDRDREAQRVLRRSIGRERMTWIHGDLVGERCERGENPGAAHDDPVLGVARLVQRDRVVDELGVGRPVDRRVDDGVGERDVLERQLTLEGDEVGVALDVGVVGTFPPGPFPGETGERHVHVVRGAPHESHRRLGDAAQPFVAALQVGLRPRDHVADVDLVTGVSVLHQAVGLAFELPVEDGRH